MSVAEVIGIKLHNEMNVNSELGGIKVEVVMSCFKLHPDTYMEELKKHKNLSYYTDNPGLNSNWVTPK
jgi:hypothetical protein